MRVSCRVSKQIFEAAEATGINRNDLVRDLGDAVAWSNTTNDLEWSELAALFDALERECRGEPARIRAVGRALVHAPTWRFIQRLARTLLPLRRIYQAGAEWITPAQFPHLVLDQRFVSARELRIRASIPEPYAPTRALFFFFEGVLEEVPRLLGLPRARLVESDVKARTMDSLVELPKAASFPERLARQTRSLLFPTDLVDVFDDQRRELTSGLAALQTESLEVKSLFEGLPDLVIVHRAGTILWKNGTCTKVLGYEGHDDLVGRSLLDVVAPTSRAFVASRMAIPVDTPVPELVETLLLTRDGHPIPVEVAPSREVIFGGAPARLVVARDITERTRMQHRLAIADRMAAIGLLAAGVAHEVNNPLGYVLNNIEIANRELLALGDATRKSREALSVALEGVERIRTIVQELVKLSRVDERSLGPVDLQDVVESTLALTGPDLATRTNLVRDYEHVPLVRGSAARLGQVLLNLIMNADDAMARSPHEENELRVVLRRTPSGGAKIEISDTGVGVPPEHSTRIFEPFFTTKPTGQGTGLGLAVSQMLVAELGGELTFSPRAPRGSTFCIELSAA